MIDSLTLDYGYARLRGEKSCVLTVTTATHTALIPLSYAAYITIDAISLAFVKLFSFF